jgi:hypothetical protein
MNRGLPCGAKAQQTRRLAAVPAGPVALGAPDHAPELGLPAHDFKGLEFKPVDATKPARRLPQ